MSEGIFAERLQEFVTLSNRKAELNAELAGVQEQLTRLEPLLLDDFAECGAQSMNVNGRTVYKSRERSVTMIAGIDRWRMAEALLGMGLDSAIQASSQSLASFYKEANENGSLSELDRTTLSRFFNINEFVRLRSRKS